MSSLNIQTITPENLFPIMQFCRAEKMSLLLLGEPGCGKSEMTSQYADLYCDGNLLDERLSTIQAIDIRGSAIPDLETRKTVFLPPEFLPDADDPTCPKNGVLFFDEIDRAAPDIQAAAMSILQERRVGKKKLPDGWLVMAAGNGTEFSDQTYEMDPAIADRLVIVRMKANPESVIEWGNRTGRLDPLVTSYLRTNPDDVSHGTQRRETGALVGASPRGWERVSKVLFARNLKSRHAELMAEADKETDPIKAAGLRNQAMEAKAQDDARALTDLQRQAIIAGIIGNDAASRFFMYVDRMDTTVKIDEMMAEKDRTKRREMIPATTDGLYYLGYGIVRLIKDRDTAITAMSIVNDFNIVAERNPDISFAEIKVAAMEKVFARIAELKLYNLIGTEEYKTYDAERQSILGLTQ